MSAYLPHFSYSETVVSVCGAHVPPAELVLPFGTVMLVPGAKEICLTVASFGPVASVQWEHADSAHSDTQQAIMMPTSAS